MSGGLHQSFRIRHRHCGRHRIRLPTPSAVLEAHMKQLLLTVTFPAMLVSLAEAQQVPASRVADLVQAGKVRVGMHSLMYTKDSQTGEIKAASVGIILIDIARALGAR